MPTVNSNALRSFIHRLYIANGLSAEDAWIVADCLVEADLCGVETHGSLRTGLYLERMEHGALEAKTELTVEQENTAMVRMNAHNGNGMVCAHHAMQRCIEKAHKSGCCFITVNNANHFGMAAYYSKMAAKANMFGFVAANCPPNIAPWGSSTPYFGTNPFSVAVPTSADPIVLDMATSVVAMGKITMAAKLGKDIPLGWALDQHGKPTTDSRAASNGTLLPVGGPKGYGMSMFIDILCGFLADAMNGPRISHFVSKATEFVPPMLGQMFCVVDIGQFTPIDRFKQRVDAMREEVKGYPKNEGVSEIFMPGEIELRKKADRLTSGIPMSDVVYSDLVFLGKKYKIPLEF